MKIEIALVVVLQAIFIAECRLRKKGSNEDSELSLEQKGADEASSEADTPVKIYDDEDTGKSEKTKYKMQWRNEKNKEQYEREKAAGSYADVLAPNQHYSMSNLFKDLGRRFVPQYPYFEKDKQELEDKKAEDYLHQDIQDNKAKFEKEDMKLIPLRNGDRKWYKNVSSSSVLRKDAKPLVPVVIIDASPDLVLSVARQSKVIEDAKPINPAEELVKKQILRSGDYWNGVWKEDVDTSILRTGHEKVPLKDKVGPLPKLGSIRTKIMPGTKLYQLISVLKHVSPRFLYVMNENK